jgi:hypothetical protein
MGEETRDRIPTGGESPKTSSGPVSPHRTESV